jgi:predicted phage-related endonuclease
VIRTYQSREEWLAARESTPWLGGSDAPTVWGVGWSSPYAKWSAMAGITADERQASYAMRRGSLLEPAIGQMFTFETGLPATRPGETEWTVYHNDDERPWIGATPDFELVVPDSWDPFAGDVDSFGNDAPARLRDEPGVLQVKSSAGGFISHEWEVRPPLKYSVQVQHELYATGRSWGVLAVDFGHAMRWAWIERDEAFLAQHLSKLDLFWRAVQEKEWTDELDESQATYDALKAQYDEAKEPHGVALGPGLTKWATMHDRGHALKLEGDDAKEFARNNLCAALGDHEEGVLPNGRKVTWKFNRAGNRTFRLGKKP